MKKILTMLLMFFIVSIAFGQKHRTNDYGILFGVGDDFLSPPVSIMDTGIGAMIHLDNFAIRPTLQFGTTSTDNGTEKKQSIFGLGGAIIKYLNENRVCPYYGAGLNFTTFSEKNGTETSGTSFRIYGVGGVEFFVYKNVSLGAEYHLGYQSTSSKTEYSSQYADDDKSSTSSFGFDAVKVMCTIYVM